MIRSRLALVLLCILMLSIPPSLAKPGGQGDGDRDFSCAESCHVGNSGAESSATATIELDRSRVFTGQTISLSVKVSGMELSKKGLVGVFLLSSLSNGAGKSIEDSGWTIVQDPNGGDNNYVEKPVLSASQGATFTWVLRAPDNPNTVFVYTAIHHGSNPNPNDIAYQGSWEEPLTIEIEEMPENLPRLSKDWSPTSSRIIGQTTTIELTTEDADSLSVEWRLGDTGSIQTVDVSEDSEERWSFTLPATTDDSNLSWRAKMSNSALEETTPWFTLSSDEPPYDISESAMFMQALALGILVAAIAMAIQRRLARTQNSPELAQLTTSLPSIIDIPTSDSTPPLPETGLPQGWTMDQWRAYGQQYLDKQGVGQE